MDKNLSAFEPNRTFLNRGEFRFLDITWLSGADSIGDGRGALVADIDGDLAPDLIVRNIGGGAVRVYRNRFPAVSRLTVTLLGSKSNRLGIGARVVVEADGHRRTRQLFPINNYTCQQASRLRFGLGDANRVDRLTVHWPSGEVTRLEDVAVNRHIRIREKDGGYDVISPR